MRLSTIIISSAFVLAGMSAALSTERENMLLARFADSELLAEVEARAYDELYARGIALSRPARERNWDSRPESPPQLRRTSSREPLLERPSSSRKTAAYRSNGKSRSAFELVRD